MPSDYEPVLIVMKLSWYMHVLLIALTSHYWYLCISLPCVSYEERPAIRPKFQHRCGAYNLRSGDWKDNSTSNWKTR